MFDRIRKPLLAFAALAGFQVLGGCVARVFALPIPGPALGMALLSLALVLRRRPEPTPALDRVANALLTRMGLLFVPAGVGVMAHAGLLRAEWLPIVAGLVGSSLAGLVVTALVMQRLLATAAPPTPPQGVPERVRHAH